MREITLRTARRTQLMEITTDVERTLSPSPDGVAALVYVPHTTAGVTINERADPAVARDLERALERIVDARWSWEHVEGGEENGPAHVRSSLMGPQVVVPLHEGRLALGTWQGIFLCELDGPRRRSVYVSVLR